MNLLTIAAPWDYAVAAPIGSQRYATVSGMRGLLIEAAAYAGTNESVKLPADVLSAPAGTVEAVFSHSNAPSAYGRIFAVGTESSPPFSDDALVIRRNTASSKMFQLVAYTNTGSTYFIVPITMTNDITAGRRYYAGMTWSGTSLVLTITDLDTMETVSGSVVLSRALSFSDETHVWLGSAKGGTTGHANIVLEQARFSSVVRSAAEQAASSQARIALDADTTALFLTPGAGEALAVRSDGKTVQFPCSAGRSGDETTKLRQLKALDSSGARWVYDKGLQRQISHRPRWAPCPDTTKAVVSTLFGVHVAGSRYAATWIDHVLTPRTVRLNGKITVAPVEDGYWAIEIPLTEDVA